MMKLSLMSKVVATVNKEHSSPLAHEISSKWFSSIEKVVYWRASSNFIFEVVSEQCSYVLRFNSIEERSVEMVSAEVEVLNYLADNGFKVSKPLKSLAGNYYELVNTDLGTFIAIVYKKITGVMYEFEDLREDQIKLWGAKLGSLHNALKGISNLPKRSSWQELMTFIKEYIKEDECYLLSEYQQVYDRLNNLPINNENYGLIHFDFETDNVIFKDTDLSIIDFDDMCVMWFTADILYAVRSMFNGEIDLHNKEFKIFIEGYKSEKELKETELANLPLFMRFHRLYCIARLRRSLDIKDFNQHPKWVEKLTNRIENNFINGSIEDIKNNKITVR